MWKLARAKNKQVEMKKPELRLHLDREAREEYLHQLEQFIELDVREEKGMPQVSGQDPITEFLIAMHCLCFGELVDAMINEDRWSDEMAFIITLGAVKYLDATSGDPEKDIIFENPFTHEMMTVMPEGMRGGRIMHMAITMVCNDWWVVVGGVRT